MCGGVRRVVSRVLCAVWKKCREIGGSGFYLGAELVAWSFLFLVNRHLFTFHHDARQGQGLCTSPGLTAPPSLVLATLSPLLPLPTPASPYKAAPNLVSPRPAVLAALCRPLLRASLPYLQPSMVHINNIRLPGAPLTWSSNIICARPGVLSSGADDALPTDSQRSSLNTPSVAVARSPHRLPNLAPPPDPSPMVCLQLT